LGSLLGSHARREEGPSGFGPIGSDSSQGDSAQEEKCPVGGGLRYLRLDSTERGEAQWVAESLGLSNSLHSSDEDTGPNHEYRLHQRLAL
jgi:hypothetical protein